MRPALGILLRASLGRSRGAASTMVGHHAPAVAHLVPFVIPDCDARDPGRGAPAGGCVCVGGRGGWGGAHGGRGPGAHHMSQRGNPHSCRCPVLLLQPQC